MPFLPIARYLMVLTLMQLQAGCDYNARTSVSDVTDIDYGQGEVLQKIWRSKQERDGRPVDELFDKPVFWDGNRIFYVQEVFSVARPQLEQKDDSMELLMPVRSGLATDYREQEHFLYEILGLYIKDTSNVKITIRLTKNDTTVATFVHQLQDGWMKQRRRDPTSLFNQSIGQRLNRLAQNCQRYEKGHAEVSGSRAEFSFLLSKDQFTKLSDIESSAMVIRYISQHALSAGMRNPPRLYEFHFYHPGLGCHIIRRKHLQGESDNVLGDRYEYVQDNVFGCTKHNEEKQNLN